MYLFLKYASMLLLVGYLLPYPCMAQQNTAKTSPKLEIKEIGRQTVSVPSISEENPSVLLNTNKEITKNYKCRADFDGVNKLAVRLEDGTIFPIRTLGGNTKISTDGNRIFNVGFHPMLQAGYIAIEILDRQGKVIKYCETDLVARMNFNTMEFQEDGTFWIAGLRYEKLPKSMWGSRAAKSKVVFMHFDANGNQLNEIEAPVYEDNFNVSEVFAIDPSGAYLGIIMSTVETFEERIPNNNVSKLPKGAETKVRKIQERVPKGYFFNQKGQLIHQQRMKSRVNFIKFIDKNKFVLFDKDECSIYHIDTKGNVREKRKTNIVQLLGDYSEERLVRGLVSLEDEQLAVLFETFPRIRKPEFKEISDCQLMIIDMQKPKILAQHRFKAPVQWSSDKNLNIKDNVLGVLTRKETIQFKLNEK